MKSVADQVRGQGKDLGQPCGSNLEQQNTWLAQNNVAAVSKLLNPKNCGCCESRHRYYTVGLDPREMTKLLGRSVEFSEAMAMAEKALDVAESILANARMQLTMDNFLLPDDSEAVQQEYASACQKAEKNRAKANAGKGFVAPSSEDSKKQGSRIVKAASTSKGKRGASTAGPAGTGAGSVRPRAKQRVRNVGNRWVLADDSDDADDDKGNDNGVHDKGSDEDDDDMEEAQESNTSGAKAKRGTGWVSKYREVFKKANIPWEEPTPFFNPSVFAGNQWFASLSVRYKYTAYYHEMVDQQPGVETTIDLCVSEFVCACGCTICSAVTAVTDLHSQFDRSQVPHRARLVAWSGETVGLRRSCDTQESKHHPPQGAG